MGVLAIVLLLLGCLKYEIALYLLVVTQATSEVYIDGQPRVYSRSLLGSRIWETLTGWNLTPRFQMAPAIHYYLTSTTQRI